VNGLRRLTRSLFAGLLLLGLAVASNVRAHEVRPAYLQIDETAPGQFSVLWRTPVLAGMRLPLVLKLPEGVSDLKPPLFQELSDSRVERHWIDAGPQGLAGKRIEIAGLQLTITDVLVRVKFLDGRTQQSIVRPAQPWVEIAASQGSFAVLSSYVTLGIEHILFGYDHLLFVLALILIVRTTRVLVWTITAFTLAHSVTLALATLGVVHVPGPPVEATIALSIVLLAGEILRARRGAPSLAADWPWLVAFTFGLLHGFGFAGALTAIGLPSNAVPLALFGFNVGVELGQLMFIGAVLAALAALKRLPLPRPLAQHAMPAAAYAIGSLATFWLLERVAGFWA